MRNPIFSLLLFSIALLLSFRLSSSETLLLMDDMVFRIRFGVFREFIGTVKDDMIIPPDGESSQSLQSRRDSELYYREIYTYRRRGSTYITFDNPEEPSDEKLLKFKNGDELWRPSFTGNGPYAKLSGSYFYELHPPKGRRKRTVEPQQNDRVQRNGAPRAKFIEIEDQNGENGERDKTDKKGKKGEKSKKGKWVPWRLPR